MLPQNKKFLAQREKEERQKRIIIISTIAVAVIVLGLVVFGVIDRYVLTPNVVVLELENQSINAEQFEQQVRWRRRNLIVDIDQMLTTFQQLGGSPEIYAYFEQQLTSNVSFLQQPQLIGQQVLDTLQEDLILLVEADKMGIVIDDSRIDRELQQAFGFFADGTPTPAVTQAPTSTPESADDDGAADPTATPIIVPTVYTEENFNEDFQRFLDNINDNGITEDAIRYVIKMAVIRQAISEKVTEDVESTAEHVWIRHILVEDEETANLVSDKLADGEDFADLAAEYSIDTSNKDNGGDLGWFTFGRMVTPFEVAAFALDVGEISDPVMTDFGFHILESLGREDRELEQSDYQALLSSTFFSWLTEKQAEYEPVVNENWAKYVPTEPSIPPEYITYIQSLAFPQPQPPAENPTSDDSPDSDGSE